MADAVPNRMLTAQQDDDQLMRLVAAGATAAFRPLVDRHDRAARAYAARRLGQASLAEEVVQSTWTEVFRYASRYEGTGRFRAFLFTILRRQCLMAQRARGRRQAVALGDHEPALIAGIEASVADRQAWARVHAVLPRLSASHRAALELRYLADRSYSECADELGVPVSTVKSRVAAALAAVRAQLPEAAAPRS